MNNRYLFAQFWRPEGLSPGYQLGWVLVRALLQVADVSLCPHMVKRARGLSGVCFIRMLIPFRGLHPSTTNWHWVWCSLDFPHSSASKESICNAGDLGSIPGSGRSPGEGNCSISSHLFPCLGLLQGRVGFVLETIESPALSMMLCNKSPGMQLPNIYIHIH